MKNVCFSLAFMLIGSFAFANTKEVKNETSKLTTSQTTKVVKAAPIPVYCGGKLKGYISCDSCTVVQIAYAAWAMCN